LAVGLLIQYVNEFDLSGIMVVVIAAVVIVITIAIITTN
jgi:hypothetical protein